MKATHPLTLVTACALMCVALSAFAGTKTKDRLATGEVIVSSKAVPGSDAPVVTAMAVIDAAPQAVWALISKCADYKRTMVRTLASKEIWRKGNKIRCRVTVDLPFPLSDLTATTDAVHTVKKGKKWERKWALVEGDYKRNTGSWTLAPFNGAATRTLVIYRVHAEPKVAIPAGIRRAAQRKSLPNLIEHLRKQLAP